MKTLDYIHLDASAVSNVVASLKQLLADYHFKKTIIIFEKHVRVFLKSRTCFSGNTYDFLQNHTARN